MTRFSHTPEPGVRQRPRPIARFLGDEEAAGGPFAVLGLSPTACTDDLVLSALDRQIERIDRHPECDTPEADEVRLALHAAAAQLLDPIVRRHLVAKWTGQRIAAAAPVRHAAPQPAGSPVPSAKLLEADAILTLGIFGGWNQRSLRRLMSLARARGMTNTQVAQTLANLSKRRRVSRAPAPRPVAPRRHARSREEFEALERPASAPLPPTPRAPVSALPEPDEVDPAKALLRNAMIFGAVGLVGLFGAFVLIMILTANSPAPVTPPPKPAPAAASAPVRQASDPASGPPETAKPAPAPAPPIPVELAALTREISACAEGVQTEPAEAIARFERAMQTLGASWPQVPQDRLIACHDSILEFIYKASTAPDITLRAVAAVGAGAGALASPGPLTPDHVLPAAWSSGILVRLARERDLSASARGAIESRIASGLGQARPALEQTFEAGAGAALSLIPARLTPAAAQGADAPVDLEAWRRWEEGVDALAGKDSAVRLRLLLSGLETLLVSAPEPNVNRGVSDAIAELTLRITWRPEDESRRWLLRWFADQRITPADLHAVTSTLATRSSAEGVDLTMVLSTSASDKLRADLRDRFATVWSLGESLNRDDLTTAWIKAAKEAINKSYATGEDAEELASAVVLARLNEAASWQWRGDGGEAARIVGDLRPPVDQALTPTNANPTAVKLELSDGAWAEKYLAARQNLKVRRDLMEQLTSGGGPYALGAVDAEVLVGEALTGSPAEFRAQALEAVKRYSEGPAIVNAVLERLPRMQRTPTATSLIEYLTQRQLPPARDPDWPIVARRVLVERLLEAIAAESSTARVDRLATLLAVSYRSMASAAPLSPDQRAIKSQPPAERSAAMAWQRWRMSADAIVPTAPPPIPLDQIDRRRNGRLSQAHGMVQAFAAEEASICEVVAYIVNAEQPAKADQVKLVLSQLGEDRRRATSVLHQINVSERAMTQLWLLRFKEDLAS